MSTVLAARSKQPVAKSFQIEMIELPNLFEEAFLKFFSTNTSNEPAGKGQRGRMVKFTKGLNLRFYTPGSPKNFGRLHHRAAFVVYIKNSLWAVMHGTLMSGDANEQYKSNIVAIQADPRRLGLHRTDVEIEQEICNRLTGKENLSHAILAGDRYGTISCPSTSTYTSRMTPLINEALCPIDHLYDTDQDYSKIQRSNSDHYLYTWRSVTAMAKLISKGLEILS